MHFIIVKSLYCIIFLITCSIYFYINFQNGVNIENKEILIFVKIFLINLFFILSAV